MCFFIENHIFNKKEQDTLNMFQDVTTYVASMNIYEKRIYSDFQIFWLLKESQPIGYSLLGKVKASFFDGEEDAEDIIEVLEPGIEYYYIPYFEVFEPYQYQGLGSYFLNGIKEKTGMNHCIVYCTEDSEGFWLKTGFLSANFSDWWLQYVAS